MKKLIPYLITAFMLLSYTPAHAGIEGTVESPIESSKLESAEAKALINRLDEINAIDKSNMKSYEKRQLRKEVRSIKKSLSDLGGGVYLSVGAIIIIILLLILLL
jgi:hypothetical protein